MLNHLVLAGPLTIDAGPYCTYCVGADGKLQPFEDRFERMVQWQQRQEPALDRKGAEAKTRANMQKMPAWKDHPRLRE